MLRNDGSVVIFLIQHRYQDKPKSGWSESGGSLHAKIPQELRFIDPRTAKATPLFAEYNQTWQETSHHGWKKLDSALEVMKLLAKHNPEHRFRVIQRYLSMKTTVVSEMKYPKED